MDDLTRFFHPVLRACSLGTKPIAVTLGGRKYAIWRDASGAACAVVDACPHRNASLSRGRVRPDGRLACGYHGWHFDGDGRGSCPSQPKLRCDTRSLQVVERHGTVWVASRGTPLSALPEVGAPGYELAGAFATHFEAPIHITLDNFTEDEHFPYVHQWFGWDEASWPAVRYEATNHEDWTEATYVGPQRPAPVLPLIGVRPGDLFHNHFESRFDPVRTVYTSHWTSPDETIRRPIEARTVVFMVPETDRTTRFHTFVYVRVAEASLFHRLRPMIRLVARGFVMAEWWMDARWVRHMADVARDLEGLRLGKFDKTVIRNRKLLRTIYLGEDREAIGGEAQTSN